MKDYPYRLATDQEAGPPSSRMVQGGRACFIKFFLKGLSFFYGLGVKAVLCCYEAGLLKRHRLPRPVISVGNITWGGVGKTPLVELIAGYLKEGKLKPVILIRGYMPEGSSPFSDEAKVLQENLGDIPVVVGRNRWKTAQEALNHHSVDAFILDDGFQHWRIARGLDIVAVDTTNPFGNGHLIPRGILREPLEHLRRAHIFVLTKTDFGRANLENIKLKLRKLNPEALIVESVHQAVGLVDLCDPKRPVDLGLLRAMRVCAFCSIGDPESFKNMLSSLGARVVCLVPFRDHYQYDEKDVRYVVDQGKAQGAVVFVTTPKDAVKLAGHLKFWQKGNGLFSLRIRLAITQGQQEFYARISHLLER